MHVHIGLHLCLGLPPGEKPPRNSRKIPDGAFYFQVHRCVQDAVGLGESVLDLVLDPA